MGVGVGLVVLNRQNRVSLPRLLVLADDQLVDMNDCFHRLALLPVQKDPTPTHNASQTPSSKGVERRSPCY